MTTVSDDVETPVDLAEMVRQHQAGVWRYLRFLGADRAEADDLTQETFLAVARRPFQHRGTPQTSAYLRAVARNQLLMFRRRQDRQVSTVELEAAEGVWAELAGADGSLDVYLESLDDCLEKIHGRARRAVDLHYRDGASRADIAAKLDMKPEGVKTLLRRTRELLGECIQRRLNKDDSGQLRNDERIQ